MPNKERIEDAQGQAYPMPSHSARMPKFSMPPGALLAPQQDQINLRGALQYPNYQYLVGYKTNGNVPLTSGRSHGGVYSPSASLPNACFSGGIGPGPSLQNAGMHIPLANGHHPLYPHDMSYHPSQMSLQSNTLGVHCGPSTYMSRRPSGNTHQSIVNPTTTAHPNHNPRPLRYSPYPQPYQFPPPSLSHIANQPHTSQTGLRTTTTSVDNDLMPRRISAVSDEPLKPNFNEDDGRLRPQLPIEKRKRQDSSTEDTLSNATTTALVSGGISDDISGLLSHAPDGDIEPEDGGQNKRRRVTTRRGRGGRGGGGLQAVRVKESLTTNSNQGVAVADDDFNEASPAPQEQTSVSGRGRGGGRSRGRGMGQDSGRGRGSPATRVERPAAKYCNMHDGAVAETQRDREVDDNDSIHSPCRSIRTNNMKVAVVSDETIPDKGTWEAGRTETKDCATKDEGRGSGKLQALSCPGPASLRILSAPINEEKRGAKALSSCQEGHEAPFSHCPSDNATAATPNHEDSNSFLQPINANPTEELYHLTSNAETCATSTTDTADHLQDLLDFNFNRNIMGQIALETRPLTDSSHDHVSGMAVVMKQLHRSLPELHAQNFASPTTALPTESAIADKGPTQHQPLTLEELDEHYILLLALLTADCPNYQLPDTLTTDQAQRVAQLLEEHKDDPLWRPTQFPELFQLPNGQPILECYRDMQSSGRRAVAEIAPTEKQPMNGEGLWPDVTTQEKEVVRKDWNKMSSRQMWDEYGAWVQRGLTS